MTRHGGSFVRSLEDYTAYALVFQFRNAILAAVPQHLSSQSRRFDVAALAFALNRALDDGEMSLGRRRGRSAWRPPPSRGFGRGRITEGSEEIQMRKVAQNLFGFGRK